MSFDALFKLLSYLTVLCGFLALFVSGTFGVIGTSVFLAVLVLAWFLEGSKWQVSERLGTVLIVLALPVYYAAWRYGLFNFGDSGTAVAGVLGRLILSLTAIKLLQRKSDRDWIFLYLMAFFEVLLAAGLSISALYLLSFVVYVFVMACTIIVFEIRKTARTTREKLAPHQPDGPNGLAGIRPFRLPLTAGVLIIFIVALALPLFFILPRVGGAGIGTGQGNVSAASGFSDTVRLGGIGDILQSDEVVMRVRLEGSDAETSALKWRGVALDTFDHKAWSRTRAAAKEPRLRSERDIIQVDYPRERGGVTIQTVYLEPLDTPVLFALPRAIIVQGNFPVLYRDKHGSISFNRIGERISYKVLSDRSLPSPDRLRSDRTQYSSDLSNYLQLPVDLDGRIAELSYQVTAESGNRYDAAAAVESYLQNNFGYSLSMRAAGPQPLADFLFNIREGHCEYFATAMAVMLRTQGIATRVVNGFADGQYNETAGVWVVRQRNAHSWVEVYFPGDDVWVPFDPTPFAGRPEGGTGGIADRINNYLEALETFWIQYFVAFDNQEQRSMFTSVRRTFTDYQTATTIRMNRIIDQLSAWWAEARGDQGLARSVAAIGWALLFIAAFILTVVLVVWSFKRIARSRAFRKLIARFSRRGSASAIEFYKRMVGVLELRGMIRKPGQTPLEFAYAVGSREAILLTEYYNQVRFGGRTLTTAEAHEVDEWLKSLEEEDKSGR